MGVRDRVTAWALARPHVLLVPSPDDRALRRRVEDALDRRRWVPALSPADADALLEVGTLDAELAAAADVLWDQVPRPRVRRSVAAADDVVGVLDGLAADLPRAAVRPEGAGPGSGPAGRPDAASAVDADDGDAGHEDGGHEEDGGHHHHHGGEVAGLPMAGTEADRDGMELDALQVGLGPVLAGWPVGLTVHGRLQGDVLTGVQVRTCAGLSAHVVDPLDVDRTLALDALADLLLVAGWPTAARDARRERAAVADEHPDAGRRVRRLTRSVRASRSLRWSVRGLGVAPATAPWPVALRGDVLDRVRRWCDAAEQGEGEPAADPTPVGPDVWAALLEGAELASVRLTVASLAPGLWSGRRVSGPEVVTSGG